MTPHQKAESADQPSSRDPKRTWHHQGPVVFSPVFDWPPKPLEALSALTLRWVTITRLLLFLIVALCVYHLFYSDLSQMTELSLHWVLPVFIRNILLMTVVAGGLHYYFFVLRGQDKKLKFDHKEEMEKSKRFKFGNQLHDNIFWSLASGATVWSCYEVLYFWGAANGVIPVFGFTDHPLAFFAWLLLLPIALSSHFYVIHRLLHWPPLFQRFHLKHHLNIHIGPWSGMSMHPVEHIIYISSVLLHFVIASHPVIVLFHLYSRCMGPAFSHAGFEKLLIKDRKIIEAADFHHQLHHKYFECNYGTVDTPWDRWFGSVHDGSDEATVRIQERRRRMYHKRK